MSTLARYFRLFGHFVAFSFSRAFEFRFDFYMRIIMDVLYYGVAIAFFRILYLHTPSIGGWNEPQMMVFVAAYCVVDALNMTLFSNNMWQLAMFVNRGDLDYYLIRPVSSLFFLSLRSFAANSFVNLLMTFGMMFWALERYPESIVWWKLLLFFFFIFNGTLIFYCLNMLSQLPVFFTHSGQGFGNMIWSLMKLGERPDGIFVGWVRRVLTTILPFALIASFPTRLVVDDIKIEIILRILAVSFGLWLVLLWAWRRAIRGYSSASS